MMNIKKIIRATIAEPKKVTYSINNVTIYGVKCFTYHSAYVTVDGVDYMVVLYRHRLTLNGYIKPFRGDRPIGKITVIDHGTISTGYYYLEILY